MRPGSVSTAYFIDTSALLKAYIQEKGTEAMDRIFQEDAPKTISSMGLVEAVSVLQRLRSVEKVLSEEQFALLCARLVADANSGRLEVRNATPYDIQAAIDLEMRRYLTAVDAVQIALASEMDGSMVFVSADEKLNRVAIEVGLKVLDPTTN